MAIDPIKPKEYFAKLLGLSEDQVDYSDNPPSGPNDWRDAEFLLPVTEDEFHAIEKFIDDRRRLGAKAAHRPA